MARLPLMVLPGMPHHVTQRGNRRACMFFEDADCALYLDLLAEADAAGSLLAQEQLLMPGHDAQVARLGHQHALQDVGILRVNKKQKCTVNT